MSDAPQVLLDHHLKTLKLPTFLREYGKLARQCASEGVDHVRYLHRLAELELIDRERRMVERRIKAARFPVVKSLDAFDFKVIPSLNKTLVLELARCEYVDRRENVITLGNSGTGKTHVALGLGLAACQKGLSVGFTTAAALVHEMIEARDEKQLLRFQKRLASYKLLIILEQQLSAGLGQRHEAEFVGCSASATSVARSWSPPTCRSTSGPRCSAPSASPGSRRSSRGCGRRTWRRKYSSPSRPRRGHPPSRYHRDFGSSLGFIL